MDDKDLNLLKNIPLEQAAQPKPYSTQNPNYLGEI